MSLLLVAEREHFEDEEEFIIFSSSTTLQFHSDVTPLAAAAAHGERETCVLMEPKNVPARPLYFLLLGRRLGKAELCSWLFPFFVYF